MTINETNLQSLQGKLSTTFSNFSTDGTNAINSYVSAQNNIWRSPKSQALAKEIQTCLDSAIKNIGVLQNEMRSSIRTNVQNHNTAEGIQLSFSYDYSSPSTSKLDDIEVKFADSSIGLLEGHTINEIKPNFVAITNVFRECFTSMLSAVNSSPIFSDTQQNDLVDKIVDKKNEFEADYIELLNSWNTRTQNEDSVRSKEASIASSNISNI